MKHVYLIIVCLKSFQSYSQWALIDDNIEGGVTNDS